MQIDRLLSKILSIKCTVFGNACCNAHEQLTGSAAQALPVRDRVVDIAKLAVAVASSSLYLLRLPGRLEFRNAGTAQQRRQ